MKKFKNLIIATKNTHKTSEFKTILGKYFDNIEDLTGKNINMPPENGKSFLDNAKIKVNAIKNNYGSSMIIADDSGLEVDGLNGLPGVHSARYAGLDASDADNRFKLVTSLKRDDKLSRVARFWCIIAFYIDDSDYIKIFKGKVEGEIILEERGENGFGYDSIFIPFESNERKKTFAEMSGDEKNKISHRFRALDKFIKFLEIEIQR